MPRKSKPEKKKNLIELSDFESIQVKVQAVNLTSGAAILSLEDVAFLEISEKGLTLSLPSASCQIGHRLNLEIQATSQKTVIKMTATAKVLKIEKTGVPIVRVTLSFLQYEKETWERVVGLFTQRQNSIEVFFKAVQGAS